MNRKRREAGSGSQWLLLRTGALLFGRTRPFFRGEHDVDCRVNHL